MQIGRVSRLIGFFIVLAVVCLFAANNFLSVRDGNSRPLFAPNSQIKNIVFFIGDGMGLTQIAATRIKTFGADGRLHMEKMPVTGLINTHSANGLITDSAAAGTASVADTGKEAADTSTEVKEEEEEEGDDLGLSSLFG